MTSRIVLPPLILEPQPVQSSNMRLGLSWVCYSIPCTRLSTRPWSAEWRRNIWRHLGLAHSQLESALFQSIRALPLSSGRLWLQRMVLATTDLHACICIASGSSTAARSWSPSYPSSFSSQSTQVLARTKRRPRLPASTCGLLRPLSCPMCKP